MEGPRPNLPSLPFFHRNAPGPKPTTMAARQNPRLSTGGKGKRKAQPRESATSFGLRGFYFYCMGGGGGGLFIIKNN
ncbi:hypothetical protein CGRA01v4_03952 [Colletotrichum graminicola]|nr:hypothetical protein CGRA01v4_03952 [Colletotrichum graminicola]